MSPHPLGTLIEVKSSECRCDGFLHGRRWTNWILSIGKVGVGTSCVARHPPNSKSGVNQMQSNIHKNDMLDFRTVGGLFCSLSFPNSAGAVESGAYFTCSP